MRLAFKHAQKALEAQAILFDLDGTLVQSTDSIGQILMDWADSQGLDATAVNDFSHGKRTIDIVRQFIAEDAVQQHYEVLTTQFVAAANQTTAIAGALDFLNQLNLHHIPWIVVSSSEAILIEARLKAAGLPLPQRMVSAEDVQRGKPSPEGYLKGAALLNVAIANCVVFEDAPSGIQAAQAAGAQLVVVGSLIDSIHGYDTIRHYDDLNLEISS